MIAPLIICFLPALFNAQRQFDYSKQSFCLEEMNTGSLSLSCPTHQLIQLGRIVYGYSWTNECSYIDKDCTMDVPREEISCSSTSNCTVRVVEHPLILQDCWNLAANYIQAEFECITGRDDIETRDSLSECSIRLDYSLQNLCQSQESDLSHGYLSTPSYPHGFTSSLNCLCVLSPSVGYSIVVELIDFHLPTCPEAGLILRLGEEIQTKCSTQNPLILLGNPHQNLTLRFYSSVNVTLGGFLIKYSVTPVMSNATIRLQCQTISSVQRTSTSFRSMPIDPLKRFPSTKPITHPPSPSPSSSNPTMLIVSITSAFVCLLIIGNLFIWFLCASQSVVDPLLWEVERCVLFRSRSSQSNHSVKSPGIPPSSSTRLKTLHSLLYLDRKSDDVRRSPSDDIDDRQSTLSNRHEELRTTCSSSSSLASTQLTHGFIIKSKFNSHERPTREI